MTQYARDMDYEYALFLQKQFEDENNKRNRKKKENVANDSMNSVVVASHNKTGEINLADPHLELIDPTPNVHALFIQFDANFFWKQLGSVAVRWSKRMYSCAGICRYESRGGMCDIALSEPLLKLRPRKDLIETLIHEMIHAYLFLTDNDRDRDGHGPKFHKHMYRINKAANINITVYHTFIDEVQLYKTHWWRCDGPCQTWKPFFGIVRRSSNRAPGPNDFWWSSHLLKCGGSFIKVKEPEKKKTSKNEDKNDKKKVNSTKGLQDISKFIQPRNSSGPSKIFTLQDLTNNSNYSNKDSTTPKIMKPNSNFIKGSSSTSQLTRSDKSVVDHVREHWTKMYTNSQGNQDTSDEDKVRSHWSIKYPETSKGTNKHIKKSRKSDSNDIKPNKKPKSDNVNNSITNYMPNFRPPEKAEREDILKDIYGEKFKLTNKFIKKEDNVKKKNSNTVIPKSPIKNMVECPSCSKAVQEEGINDHLDLCISPFESQNFKKETSSKVDTFENSTSFKTFSKESEKHSAKQKSNLVLFKNEELDLGTDINSEFFNCPVCNELVLKSMNHQLEECVSNFFQGECENIPKSSEDSVVNLISDDELDESQEFNETGTKSPCPCCLEMVEQELMNIHLDECLGK